MQYGGRRWRELKIMKIKTYHKQAFSIAFFMAVAALQLSCTMMDSSGPGKAGKEVIKFYSAANPGPWASEAADHDVSITITRVNDSKVINVQVPFAKNRERKHYVEAILLLDAKKNELQKRSFERGFGEEGARFEVPDSFNEPVFVVVKCNLHDMWERLVDWSE
jgi:desulfoferrodoxin (superoxide reductase-like protein)